jgi:hypothetical protein
MYSREAFERQRSAARKVAIREGRMLAAISVTLGIAQLFFIQWADHRLDRSSQMASEGGMFLCYIALIGWLVWRMDRRMRAVRPTCPGCGVPLKGMSERVAVATGHCDACGGQVIG